VRSQMVTCVPHPIKWQFALNLLADWGFARGKLPLHFHRLLFCERVTVCVCECFYVCVCVCVCMRVHACHVDIWSFDRILY